MGSNVALPALAVKAPQIDPLEQAGQFMKLRNMGQQSQLQNQQIQENQLALQQQQQQMKDQQTVMQIAQKYGGLTDPQALQELSSKVSAATYVPLAKSLTDQRKANADAKKDELDNQVKVGDQMGGLIAQAKQLPPDQYQQAWPTIAQKAAEIDPRLAKHINPQQPIPQQALDGIALGYMTHTQLAQQETAQRAQAEEARKAALAPSQLSEAQSTATLKAKEAQIGGTSPEMMGMQDWLSKNPGKGASDFLSWKAKQSPAMLVQGNILGNGGQGSALDQAAQRYSKTGDLPQGFSRSPGTTAAIIKRAAELNPSADIAANKATFSADSASLKKLQTNFDQVTAFEGTALKNLDLYVETAKKIPDLGARFANVPLRMITGKMIGTDNMAALNAARQTAATEAAKVLGSATASGVLSDSQKKDATDVLDGNLPLSATIKVAETLKKDFANRHQSYADDIAAIKQRMNPGGTSTPTTTNSDPFAAFGGKTKQ